MPKTNNPPRAGILETITDERLIGDTVSPAQAVALKVLYGEPLTDDELVIYRLATEREAYAPREYREADFICGRRSGKSSKLAGNTAIHEAVFRKHNLARGERGHVVVIASTQRQASVVFDYILARLEGSPTLRRLILGEPRSDEVDLTNGITISVWPCNFRSIRGISIVCAICDEIAFWRDVDTGANPASEVLKAIRPAMATFPTAKLVKITSPYAKQGVVWDDFQARHKRDDLLVWRLDSATMNPSLDRDFLAAEERRDPEFFAREYLAQFWESASGFLPPEMVDAAIVPGRYELTPQPDSFMTASLDSAFRGDNFAFSAVRRTEDNRIIQAANRCWRGSRAKPVNLAATVEEIVSILRRFGITRIAGDQHCAEPIRQALATHGIEFLQRTTLGNRAQCFNTLRTLVTSGQIELLDDPAQTAELKSLEQIVTASGSVRVEASASGHDDRAVALALAAHEAMTTVLVKPWVEFIYADTREERGWRPI
jgi:hypothetical protein